MSGRALQERRLEAGKTTLERLRSDAKKRKRRDAWDAVIRELDGAVRAAPGGARAAEAALLAARAREDLWLVSRSRRDAAAAIEAYRKVDESYTGSSQAPRALLCATRLAERTGHRKSAISFFSSVRSLRRSAILFSSSLKRISARCSKSGSGRMLCMAKIASTACSSSPLSTTVDRRRSISACCFRRTI